MKLKFRLLLAPPEVVLVTDNVVFFQIATRLHFNQFQRNPAHIVQTVFFAQRNVNALVFGQ